MFNPHRRLLAIGVLVALARPGSANQQGPRSCPGSAAPAAVWRLPNELREVSGLGASEEAGLYAHSDEAGRLLQLDGKTGRVLGRLTLQGTPKDDFEGLALTPELAVLMTSGGRLYTFGLASGTLATPYRIIETGLGRSCELEGLAWDPSGGFLLLPCKAGRVPATMAGLTIHRWSLADAKPAPSIVVSAQELARVAGTPRIRATGVEVDPVTGTVVVLSSRPRMLLSVGPEGRVKGVMRLRERDHPQPEGLAITRDAVYIGDEGVGRQGTITVYRCEGSR
jgi:uncharacterized protein YjiK